MARRGNRAAGRRPDDPREPQPRAARVGRDELDGGAAGQLDDPRRAACRRSGRGAVGARSSTIHQPRSRSGAGIAKRSSITVPGGARATAAASVAETLTTSEVARPAGGRGGRGSARARSAPSPARATIRRTSSRATRAPPAARWPPARRQLEGASALTRAPRELGGAVAAARQLAGDQRQQAGHALLRRRAVGDVLAGERVLVHLRCACRRGRPRRRAAPGARRRGWRSAAPARPSRSRSRPSPRRARRRRRR